MQPRGRLTLNCADLCLDSLLLMAASPADPKDSSRVSCQLRKGFSDLSTHSLLPLIPNQSDVLSWRHSVRATADSLEMTRMLTDGANFGDDLAAS
jgi:hypothetical protein